MNYNTTKHMNIEKHKSNILNRLLSELKPEKITSVRGLLKFKSMKKWLEKGKIDTEDPTADERHKC